MEKGIVEKIKFFILNNKGKSYSILEIAKNVDPKCKIAFSTIEDAIKILERDGIIYHDLKKDEYLSFPFEQGYIKACVWKNEKGEVFINSDNGNYYIDIKDAKYILDGDTVIVKKTNQRMGRRTVCELDKILKRKYGIISCIVNENNFDYSFTPLDENFKGVIKLKRSSLLEKYNDKDIIKVQIGENLENGVFIGNIIEDIKENKEEIINDNDIEYENYTLTGTIEFTNHNEAVVLVNGKRYLIKEKDLTDVLPNDLIKIRPSKTIKHGFIISEIETILKRSNCKIACEVSTLKNGKKILIPINYKFKHNISLGEYENSFVDGDMIIVTINENLKDGLYSPKSIQHIGHKDDPDCNLEIIAALNEIDIDFTKEELKEAESLPKVVKEEEKEKRLDLTSKNVFTIDGINTKDRDDAIHIEKLNNGHYLIGVHISDVTHYIKPGGILWNTILNRATSVYMDNTVIPMLPHIISNGICSLNPNVDRLTFSFLVEIDENGFVYNYDFVDSVINSKLAMNYDDVNKIFEDKEIKEEYKPFVNDLLILNKIAKSLQAERENNGALSFDSVQKDIEIIVDSNNKPVEFVSKNSKQAEKLIENFMLLAGKYYAEYMILPTTLRVHEPPYEEDIKNAVDILNKIGIKVDNIKNIDEAKTIYKVIKSVKDEKIRNIALGIFLKSLKKARIDVDPEIGHFALAEKKQGRFTSPIRRAEDAIGHIQLRKQRDNLYDLENFESVYDEEYKYLDRISKYITQKQLNAEKAENDALIFKMIEYANMHIGEEFSCIVTYINEYGIYVKTVNGVTGIIRPYDFEDNVTYSDKTMSYKRENGEIIKIGSEINAKILSTTNEYNTINFSVQKVKKYTKGTIRQ